MGNRRFDHVATGGAAKHKTQSARLEQLCAPVPFPAAGVSLGTARRRYQSARLGPPQAAVSQPPLAAFGTARHTAPPPVGFPACGQTHHRHAHLHSANMMCGSASHRPASAAA
jgi:hypothetical protein